MENITLNKKMVDGQIKSINGMSQSLISIFYRLDRNSFMPDNLKKYTYIEKNIILKDNRVILKPYVVAKIALHLNLHDDENVLILGSTTGYLTAILANQADTVIVVEEDKELLSFSEDVIKKNNINNVVFFEGEIAKGCLDQSPFNAIIIEGAVRDVPVNILNQLDENGRLLCFMSNTGICNARMFRKKGSIFHEETLFNCSIPILNSFKYKNSFSF